MKIPIFNEQQTYYEEYESLCFQNCLISVLEYYNVKNAYSYMNSTLSLKLNIEPNLESGYKIEFDEELKVVLPQFTSKVNWTRDGGNKYEAWEENKKQLDKNIPLIVGVDNFYLSHTNLKGKSHAFHSLILCGYEKEKVHVVDWYTPWFYKGEINLSEFLDARDSSNPKTSEDFYSGKSLQNCWSVPESTGWNEPLDNLVFDTLNTTVNQYYKETDKDFYYGINALQKLKTVIKENLTVSNRSLFLKELHKNLFDLPKRIKIFRRYLELSYKINTNYPFKELINLLQDITGYWDTFIIFILKSVYSKRESNIDRIMERLNIIVEKEEKIYALIMKIHSEIK